MDRRTLLKLGVTPFAAPIVQSEAHTAKTTVSLRFLLPVAPRVTDANGCPVPGALLYFYQSGTTAPVRVYADEALTVEHAFPVVCDASGVPPPVFFPSGKYKVEAHTAIGTLLPGYPIDPLLGEYTEDKDAYYAANFPDIATAQFANPQARMTAIWVNGQLYRRTASDPGAGNGFQDASGNWWRISHAGRFPSLNAAQADVVAGGAKVGDVIMVDGYLAPGDGGGAFYEVVGGADIGSADTHPDAPNLRIIAPVIYPEMTGCIGDGVTDDTDAFEAAQLMAAATSRRFDGRPGASYRVRRGLWLGSDGIGRQRIVESRGNGAIILLAVEDAVGIDYAGVRNFEMTVCKGWVINTASGVTALHGEVYGRIANGEGDAISSGLIKSRNKVVGAFHGAAKYIVSSESNEISGPLTHNRAGCAFVASKHDVFHNTVRITATITAPFARQDLITTSGGARLQCFSATATEIWAQVLSGTVSNGEGITAAPSGGTGTITALGPVLGPASPNVTLFTDSTFAWGKYVGDYYSNADTGKLFPCAMLLNANDLVMEQTNFNHELEGDHIWIGSAVETTGGGGLKIRDNFHHRSSDANVRFVDMRPSSNTRDISIGEFEYSRMAAGTPVENILVEATEIRFITPRIVAPRVNLGAAQVFDGGIVDTRSAETQNFTCTGANCKLDLITDATPTLGSTADNGLNIRYPATGQYNLPIRSTIAIASNTINVSAATEFIRVSGTGDVNNITSTRPINGMRIYLRFSNASVGTPVTLKNGVDNIFSATGDLVVATSLQIVSLLYDADTLGGRWYVI